MEASKDKAGQGTRGCLVVAWLLGGPASIISYTRGIFALLRRSPQLLRQQFNAQLCSPHHELSEYEPKTAGSGQATKDHRPCGRQEAPAVFLAKRRAGATFQRLVGGTGHPWRQVSTDGWAS